MKTAAFVILGILAFIGTLVVLSVIVLGSLGVLVAGSMDPQGVQREAQRQVEQATKQAAEPQGEQDVPTVETQPESQQHDSRADWVAADAQAYYDAASAGDFEYTHTQLVQFDREVFTLSDWVAANEALGTAGAAFEISDVQMVSPTTADVTVLVNGEPRYTRFELEQGSFKHSLTQEEYTMFFEATLGAATASASAAAS